MSEGGTTRTREPGMHENAYAGERELPLSGPIDSRPSRHSLSSPLFLFLHAQTREASTFRVTSIAWGHGKLSGDRFLREDAKAVAPLPTSQVVSLGPGREIVFRSFLGNASHPLSRSPSPS